MDDIYQKIFYQGYGLKLYNTSRTRRGLICKTDKGMKELRKTNNDEVTIVFEDNVKNHLYNKGFTNLDIYDKTVEGTPYLNYGEQRYLLSPLVNTVETDLNSLEVIGEAVAELAKIHLYSKGFDDEGKNAYGKLPDICHKRQIELGRIKKRINRQSNYSPMDIVVLKNYEYFSSRTAKAQELLNSDLYKAVTNKAIENNVICHLNYKGDNIRKKEADNKLFITGFDKCCCDCGITDLSEFIRRQVKNNNCDNYTIDTIIKSYDSVLTLTNDDIKILGAMILFPSKFYKLLNSYYNKRRVCQTEGATSKLINCIETSQKEEEILKSIGI